MVWFFLMVRFVAGGYAAFDSIRARFWVGLGFLGVLSYAIAALVSPLLHLRALLPLGDAFSERWWLVVLTVPPLSFAPMWLAWRRKSALPEGDPRGDALDAAAMAFLANGLLDTGLLVIFGIVAWLVSRSAF